MTYKSIFRADLFQDKVVLITGGGTGIGRAIAHEIASLGGHVVLASRKAENLETTANEIREQGGKASFYTVNIRQEESVVALIVQVLKEHGRIDALVNNAGGQFPSPASDISHKGWHAVIETNLTGTFMMSREVYTQWMAKNGGAIVNIVAEMWRGFPMMAHTGAARAGVVNLTKSLAVEWASSGVRVNAVAPGVVHGHGLTQYGEDFIKAYIKTATKDIPAQRMATESEIASAVTFLLSEGASYITGDTINVDGASSLWRKPFEIDPHDNFPRYDGFESND